MAKKVKFSSISFRANGPARGTPFSHVHIEASAEVQTGQHPDDVLQELQSFVFSRLKASQDNRKAFEDRVSLDRSIELKERELEELRRLRLERS